VLPSLEASAVAMYEADHQKGIKHCHHHQNAAIGFGCNEALCQEEYTSAEYFYSHNDCHQRTEIADRLLMSQFNECRCYANEYNVDDGEVSKCYTCNFTHKHNFDWGQQNNDLSLINFELN
jgi:hypothetical protein